MNNACQASSLNKIIKNEYIADTSTQVPEQNQNY